MNDAKKETSWDYIIKPKRGWFEIDLKNIWVYRELLKMYVKRNLTTIYRQTVLGPLWFVIQPIITILLFMFIFGGLAGLSTEGIPQPLFYMAGILLWNYFSECFTMSSNVLVTNKAVFSKVYFPRLIVPLSSAISAWGKLFVQIILFLIIYIWCLTFNSEFAINWTLLLVPVYFILIALHGLSWGLLVSSITYKYRDLQVLVSYLLQLLMYATPIVYPLETIPENYRRFVELNPLSSIFESFKYAWFSSGIFDVNGLLYSIGVLALVMIVSVVTFNRVEQNFMDTV